MAAPTTVHNGLASQLIAITNNITNHVTKVDQQLRESAAKNEKLKEDLATAKKTLTAENKKLKDDLATSKKNEDSLKDQLYEYMTENKKLEDELTRAHRNEGIWQDELGDWEAKNKKLKDDLATAKKAEESLRQQIAGATALLSGEAARLDKTSSSMAAPPRANAVGSASNPVSIVDDDGSGSPPHKRSKVSDMNRYTTPLGRPIAPNDLLREPSPPPSAPHGQLRAAVYQTSGTTGTTPAGDTSALASSPAAATAGLSGNYPEAEFIVRKDPETFLDLSALPEVVRKALEATIGELDGAKPWYRSLQKLTAGEAVRGCVHARIFVRGLSRWTLKDEAKYACMSCTNKGRVCCFWDRERQQVRYISVRRLARCGTTCATSSLTPCALSESFHADRCYRSSFCQWFQRRVDRRSRRKWGIGW